MRWPQAGWVRRSSRGRFLSLRTSGARPRKHSTRREMARSEACTVPPPPAYSRTVPATPTPLPTRPLRRRGNTCFRKTRLSANRPPRQRRSRLAAKRRVVLLGPFGEPLVTSGAVATLIPFQFSTKYQDAETGLLYYGYRYYDPNTGRWMSEDPTDELGNQILLAASPFAPVSGRSGVSRYGFADNMPTVLVDADGRVIPILIAAGLIWLASEETAHTPGPGDPTDPAPLSGPALVATVTLTICVPIDEVAAGGKIGGWVIERLGSPIASGTSACCRAIKYTFNKIAGAKKARNAGNYERETRDALNAAFKDGYNATGLDKISKEELRLAADKLKDGLEKLKNNPKATKQVQDFQQRIEMLENYLKKP